MEWLQSHFQALLELQAQGLMVSASNDYETRWMRDQLSPLSLTPVNGDSVSTLLSITEYPVLILPQHMKGSYQ